MLTRALARVGVAGVFVMGAACSDPDSYPGGGRAQMLPMEGGSAAAASDDASEAGDAGAREGAAHDALSPGDASKE